MRTIILPLLVGLTACAAVPDLSPPGPGAQSALFADYPAPLMAAAKAACSGPLQTVRDQTPDSLTCETLPTPDAAAALILEHNGTVEDLPTFIIGFHIVPGQGGTIVIADNYIRVPQRDGGEVQVRFEDDQVTRSMQQLLAAAGGTPIPTPTL